MIAIFLLVKKDRARGRGIDRPATTMRLQTKVGSKLPFDREFTRVQFFLFFPTRFYILVYTILSVRLHSQLLAHFYAPLTFFTFCAVAFFSFLGTRSGFY